MSSSVVSPPFKPPTSNAPVPFKTLSVAENLLATLGISIFVSVVVVLIRHYCCLRRQFLARSQLAATQRSVALSPHGEQHVVDIETNMSAARETVAKWLRMLQQREPAVGLPRCQMTDCPICLEELGDWKRNRVVLPCSHTFHVKCIKKWFLADLGEKPVCPICRAVIDLCVRL